MSNPEIYIQGYIHHAVGELCPSCFEDTGIDASQARILRPSEGPYFPQGLKCNRCGEYIFFPDNMNAEENHRLSVFEEAFPDHF
jgi:hypothetical protein